MRTTSSTQGDSPAAVTPPAWRVTAVSALPDYQLQVRFNDGLEGTADLASLVTQEDAGVFASLVDTTLFNQVHVDHGAVAWPGEIDLAPDALYAQVKAQAN